VVVSSVFAETQASQRVGLEAYSYHFVYRAFARLLERWGEMHVLSRGGRGLAGALRRAGRQQRDALHLSFLPLHRMPLAGDFPNVAFPFWEFPDIPDQDIDSDPRNNWVRTAERLTLILTASTFTRDALLRAGVQAPVLVVPVPVRSEYFAVPPWEPGQRTVIDCPCYVLPQEESAPAPAFDPWTPIEPRRLSRLGQLKYLYCNYLKPRLPRRLDRWLAIAAQAARDVRRAHARKTIVAAQPSPRLDLSGVVYTTFLNPFDPRKNWQDTLSAFLWALGDRADATLVVKLVVNPALAPAALNWMLEYYRELHRPHRGKVAFVTAYLTDEQLVELARASTYYLNSARAEGACLPLQDFLAAGRPGVAPTHTALADYFDSGVGFPVESHPEPASWPHDRRQGCTTTWHRIVWQSLHDQLRASFDAAGQLAHYRNLASAGRQRLAGFAAGEQVWPRLEAALALALQSKSSWAETGTAPARAA
jgi:glycosyltransferase involved in cell wall biosynthesis